MENKDPGYILLHRSLRNHWLWKNPVQLQRWIDLLMDASYSDGETECRKTHEIINLKRGTVWTTIRNLAQKWECSTGTVERFLKLLEREKMITLQGTQHGTFINVLNYCTYQDFKGVSWNTKQDANRNNHETITRQSRIQSNTVNTVNTVKEDKYTPAPPADGGEWQ